MQFPDKTLSEFATLYLVCCGKPISKKQATKKFASLVDLLLLLASVDPKNPKVN